MHRVLTLDVTDPLVPVEFKKQGIRLLPLYYPLRYGFGGSEAQYRIVSDTQIELLHIDEDEPDEEQYPFMNAFPERPFRLVPFTYEQFRAFLMVEQGDAFKPTRPDAKLVQGLDRDHLIQFGGKIFPIGGDLIWRCRNLRCKWSHVDASLDVFARVAGTPAEDLQIFGPYGGDVEIYFGLCRLCGTVVTMNRCT